MTGDLSWWMNEFETIVSNGPQGPAIYGQRRCSQQFELMQLMAVKVVFFPKKTTCWNQPCDAGIIQDEKLLYRKQLHNFILTTLTHESGEGMYQYKGDCVAVPSLARPQASNHHELLRPLRVLCSWGDN